MHGRFFSSAFINVVYQYGIYCQQNEQFDDNEFGSDRWGRDMSMSMSM